MADPLVEPDDVAAVLLRPLTTAEEHSLDIMCEQVSDLLRQYRRNIDARIAAYAADPSDRFGVAATVVAGMLAAVIKRAVINPRGLWSTSETDGDYSYSETYPGQRAGATQGTPGDIEITAADLAKLDPNDFTYRPPIHTTPGAFSMRTCW